MRSMPFLTLPIVTWLICGTVKFGVNLFRTGSEAVSRVGHGGFPSNHTAIVSSMMCALLLMREWHIAGLALAVLMVLIFDATGLRREVGRHATVINQLSGTRFREIMGHSFLDIAGGLVIGIAVAGVYWLIGVLH